MSISPEKTSEIDTEVRKLVYDHFMTHSASVSRAEVAAHLSLPEAVAEASYKRLAEAHVLVLQPASGQVLMANPFPRFRPLSELCPEPNIGGVIASGTA